MPRVEPDLQRRYLLYRPSSYDRRSAWPLIVVCHSGFPDSPNQRLRAWTELAESRGFLVIAPTLKQQSSWGGTARSESPIDTLHQHERHILAAVQHVRAGHNISEDRIFIHGWSKGATTALWTGLRNPQIFRAIALTKPRIAEVLLGDAETQMQTSQPIYLHYDVSDVITGRHGRDCAEWLRSWHGNVRVFSHGSAREGDVEDCVDFYEEIIRKEPWLRVEAVVPFEENPRQIRFTLNTSFVPTLFHWQFGDGTSSTQPEPVHLFSSPGTYTVSVTVQRAEGSALTRQTTVIVP